MPAHLSKQTYRRSDLFSDYDSFEQKKDFGINKQRKINIKTNGFVKGHEAFENWLKSFI